MSNALAIAAVTDSLVSLLGNYLDTSLVSGAHVSAVPPDGPGKLANPGVNVFLYQVTPNKAYRNADLPTRDAAGNLLRKPMAARHCSRARLLRSTCTTCSLFTGTRRRVSPNGCWVR